MDKTMKLIDFVKCNHIIPSYQRQDAWSTGKQILFIVTLLMEWSFPSFIMAVIDKVLQLHDGKQRTRCFLSFMNDEFVLRSKGIPVESRRMFPAEYEGKKWSSLTKEQQDRMKNTLVKVETRCFNTKEEASDDFMRVNNGAALSKGEALNAQSSESMGKITAAIRNLSSLPSLNDKRMADRRFIAELIKILDLNAMSNKKDNLVAWSSSLDISKKKENEYVNRAEAIFLDMQAILENDSFFWGVSDQYSLFYTINELHRTGHELKNNQRTFAKGAMSDFAHAVKEISKNTYAATIPEGELKARARTYYGSVLEGSDSLSKRTTRHECFDQILSRYYSKIS